MDKTFAEQECAECERLFGFAMTVLCLYGVANNCLSGGPCHNYEPTMTYPAERTRMKCSDCGKEREMTEAERKDILTRKTIYFGQSPKGLDPVITHIIKRGNKT